MISILMPAKNADPYLNECLESILNQTLTDWELIVVNDHSTDQTNRIMSEYAAKDPRIKVLQNEGEGIIDALSLAEQNAKGEFISRMDADDIMSENKLKSLLNALNDKNAIATSYVSYFAENILGDGYKNYERWLNGLIDDNSHYNEIYKECVLPSPNWLMHKSLLLKLGGFKNLSYPEDYDLSFKAYQHDVPIIGVKEVLHYWRDYPERTSRNHENYRDNAFLPLKLRYFVDLDYKGDKNLKLWGAGKKGKKLAQIMMQMKLPFDWLTDNRDKLNAPIYGKSLIHPEQLTDDAAQVIIAVAGPQDQLEIKSQLSRLKKVESYWFC